MTEKLQGKTALVTGASRGIGRSIVVRLARSGARVIARYGRSEEEIGALAREVPVEPVQADLASSDGPQRLADAIDGEIDILVNNAGVVTFVPWGEQQIDDFDRQYAVNVRAPFILTQALKDRIRDNGRIIFVSSVVSNRAFGDGAISAYAATKGAVDTLVIQLAPLFGARGITVNALSPGAIATEMSAWLQAEDGPAIANAVQALQRVGQADDVADVALFLASDASRWITGEVIRASGGTKL